ncbi:putative cytoplasmic protein [Salmonella enterica subsp. enterica serovar Urbana str. R8-2977]|uniref:Putative cytoplasmic protein n=1 Tax=Salmonella enterica subsp. enterica serovar Urbana str. R8-2977 TaxID=913084 RepID=G5S5L1_SALET|nr:putative cytoplasmic protein [Salmonella enterica subsp. enterica serovar Urbana str. R8-2977]
METGRETARTDMETYLNTWLAGLNVDVDGTEMMVYYLVSATDLAQAEAGVMEMGRTWWPALKREDDRYRWEYPGGVVWFDSIVLLDDVENSILRGLKFLDAWTVTGAPTRP